MKVLPCDKFVVETNEPVDVLVGRLEAHVQPRRGFLPKRGRHKEFHGSVSPEGFKIVRIIHYGNAWLPVSIGRFEATATGTRVHLTVRLMAATAAFMVFMFGLLGTCFVYGLIAVFGGTVPGVLPGRGAAPMLVGPVVMFLLVRLMANWAFRGEAKKARELIAAALQGRYAEPWRDGETDDIT